MVVRILPYVDALLPLGPSIVALVALDGLLEFDRRLLVRAGMAAVGSAFAAYGLREVLRVWGGGYYCCNHAFHAGLGLAIATVGWVFLVAALRGPTTGVD